MEDKELTKHIDNKLREFAYQVNQSSKKEQSGLVIELKSEINHLRELLEKGFTGVHNRQDETNGKVIKNSEFRIKTKAQFGVWKWIVSAIGIVGVADLILVISNFNAS